MIWSVRWSGACYADIHRMHWRTAGRICRAIMVFAEGESGHLQATRRGHLFRVPGAVALVRFDEATRTLEVQRIYATR